MIAIGAGDTQGLDSMPAPQAGHVAEAPPRDMEPQAERQKGGLSNLLRRDRDVAGGALPPDAAARLNQVLLELLELKRLLDQVR